MDGEDRRYIQQEKQKKTIMRTNRLHQQHNMATLAEYNGFLSLTKYNGVTIPYFILIYSKIFAGIIADNVITFK